MNMMFGATSLDLISRCTQVDASIMRLKFRWLGSSQGSRAEKEPVKVLEHAFDGTCCAITGHCADTRRTGRCLGSTASGGGSRAKLFTNNPFCSGESYWSDLLQLQPPMLLTLLHLMSH